MARTKTEPEAPQPDPILVRQQQLQQQAQQVNQRIMELRQQKTMIEDMITATTIQAAEIRGAMTELASQQNQK